VEYRSKANFLATFPSFVDWPDSAFASVGSPFHIAMAAHAMAGDEGMATSPSPTVLYLANPKSKAKVNAWRTQ
jgi:hypothetical protein